MNVRKCSALYTTSIRGDANERPVATVLLWRRLARDGSSMDDLFAANPSLRSLVQLDESSKLALLSSPHGSPVAHYKEEVMDEDETFWDKYPHMIFVAGAGVTAVTLIIITFIYWMITGEFLI